MTDPHRHAGDHDHDGDHAHDHDHEHDHDDEHDHEHGWWARLRHALAPHSHVPGDLVDDALEASADGIKAVRTSLVVLLATASAQAVVVTLSGSTALLADTIHNFSDALTAVPLWIAFALSRRPSNLRYTYGYGRAEDLAGVFVVLMIAGSAVLAGYESIRRLVGGADVTHPWVVAAAGLVGFAGNELVAQYRIVVGRRIGSAALVADGLHARTDGFTSLAVVAGAAGVLLGFPLADPLVGILITLAILLVLRGAATDIYRRLMDAVDPELTSTARTVLRRTPGVLEVEHLRLRWMGHRLAADAGLVVRSDLSLVDAHDVANRAHHRLLHEVPRLSDVTIHVSPSPSDGDDHHGVLRHHYPPVRGRGTTT